MEDNQIQISVIMPALNEESNIALAIDNVLNAFQDSGIRGEIIAVNDGSTDGTEVIIKEKAIKDSRIKILKHNAPLGIGASFWDGVDNAKGNVIVMLPGDNENDSWEIFRYYRLLEHVDIVIPFIFNKEIRSFFRNTLSYLYRFIINTTFLVNFNYTNGTVIYRRSILKELDYRSSGFFFQTDILIRTVKNGYLFAEVPYRLGLRKDGISKAVSFPSLLKVARGYFRLVRDYHLRKNTGKATFTGDSLTAARRDGKNHEYQWGK